MLYDFLWRLHQMDYADGENFKHWLVRASSVLAVGLVLTRLVLTVLALRRSWRVRRRHQTQSTLEVG